mmetsp:Transcript_28936/g.99926  ORF Transcript_28936/g.99926 Transcript_28936/m.99926 type:complete len:236 (+) Transcript_28936:251-958(+)
MVEAAVRGGAALRRVEASARRGRFRGGARFAGRVRRRQRAFAAGLGGGVARFARRGALRRGGCSGPPWIDARPNVPSERLCKHVLGLCARGAAPPRTLRSGGARGAVAGPPRRVFAAGVGGAGLGVFAPRSAAFKSLRRHRLADFEAAAKVLALLACEHGLGLCQSQKTRRNTPLRHCGNRNRKAPFSRPDAQRRLAVGLGLCAAAGSPLCKRRWKADDVRRRRPSNAGRRRGGG